MLHLPGRESYSKLSISTSQRINDLCTHYPGWQIKGLGAVSIHLEYHKVCKKSIDMLFHLSNGFAPSL